MSLAGRLGLLLLALFFFLPGIASRDLWNPDEPRYAEVAREMRESGDWLVPHLNGRIYSEKPPLLFWLIGVASFATGGVDAVAARLPSLAAAVAAVFLTFAIARRLFDRRIAWLAALVFASSGRILWQGRVGQIDMLLLALVALAMYGFVRGWIDGRRGFYRLFFVAAAFATLAKGPVGLLPPLLAVLAFVWTSGERHRWREIGIFSGLAIWAAIVLLWLLPAALSGGGDYLQTLLFKQNVQRFANPWHHFQPPWYYLTTVPADFFPWTLFLPGALFLGWRRSTGEERRGYRFALCWLVVTVFFFSLSPAKRTVYVLQMFPALALIVALSFGEVARSGERLRLRRWVVVPAAVLAFLLALAPAALPRVAERREELAQFGPGFVGWVAAILALLAVAAIVALAVAAAGRSALVVPALALGMGLAAATGALVLLPRFEPLKSFRPIAETFAARAAPGEPYAIYPRLEPPIVFYSKRFAELPASESELRAFAARPGRVWLFVDSDEFAELDPPLPLVEVARSAERGKSYRLLASAPEAALPPAAPPDSPFDPSSGRAQVF